MTCNTKSLIPRAINLTSKADELHKQHNHESKIHARATPHALRDYQIHVVGIKIVLKSPPSGKGFFKSSRQHNACTRSLIPFPQGHAAALTGFSNQARADVQEGQFSPRDSTHWRRRVRSRNGVFGSLAASSKARLQQILEQC